LGQLGLDLFGFGLGPGESQQMVIRVPHVPEAAVAGVHRVGGGERAHLPRQAAGLCAVAAPPCPPEQGVHLPVGGIGGAQCSPRVLRDQFLLDERVELVQVNVTEDRGNHPALRNTAERIVVIPVFQVPGFEHVTDKPQEPLVVDFLRQYPEKDLVVERPEAVGDVTLNEPCGARPGLADLPQCGVASASFPEPV